MKLSVIVPIYNEEKTIRQSLDRLLKVKEVTEVVVVNDGSGDKSISEIKKVKNKKIKVFNKDNGGKGSAIRYGLKKVTGDWVIIHDGDLEYDPKDIPDLLKVVREGKAEVVYGSRFLGPHLNLLFWHRLGNGLLNLILNMLYNTTLSDMETCYKLLPTKLFKELDIKANKFDLEPEITCKVLKKGYRIF
jgi:glycosyltransferase involved in cell wall biosynthesis